MAGSAVAGSAVAGSAVAGSAVTRARGKTLEPGGGGRSLVGGKKVDGVCGRFVVCRLRLTIESTQEFRMRSCMQRLHSIRALSPPDRSASCPHPARVLRERVVRQVKLCRERFLVTLGIGSVAADAKTPKHPIHTSPPSATTGGEIVIRALMLSTKSNLGSFLLSWWFAANTARGRSGSAPGGGTEATATAAGGDDDPMPRLVDLDHAVTSTNTFSKQGRYFCSLPWGSRCGLCKGNQTSCELAAFAQRSFCAPAGAKADAKAGGGKGRGAKGKGGGGGGGGKATGRRW